MADRDNSSVRVQGQSDRKGMTENTNLVIFLSRCQPSSTTQRASATFARSGWSLKKHLVLALIVPLVLFCPFVHQCDFVSQILNPPDDRRLKEMTNSFSRWQVQTKVCKMNLAALKRDNIVLTKQLLPLQEELRNLQAEVQCLKKAEQGPLTRQQMLEIVNSVTNQLQEDYVHVADFALESAGASIVASGTSPNYVPDWSNAPWYIFSLEHNLPLPEVILRPDVQPGNCWAFPGSKGKVVLKLARKIHPVAVTVQHIPRAISSDGDIKSALKDFEVYGLNNEEGELATFLGQFVYNSMGDPIQIFRLWEYTGTYEFVQLRVLSNWGEDKYTCLYRFRVHQELPMQLRTTETKEHETKTSSVP